MRQWKTSLPLAIGLHFLVLIAAMILPSILERHPVLPEVYTVDLFTVTELTPPAPTPARPAPAKPKVIEPPPLPEKVPVKTPASLPPAAAPVPTAPAKAISLAPRKQKTKTRKKTDPAVKRAVEQIKLSKAFQNLRNRIKEKEALKKLDRLKQEAVEKIRTAYASEAAVEATVPTPVAPVTPAADTGQEQANTTPTAETGTAPAASGVLTTDAEKQYSTNVQDKIKAHWSLPDLQNWDTTLKAVLVIKLRRDGMVVKTFFDQKSNNVHFNQSVLKAVREAAPLPPFPPELKENQIVFELRFRMEELL